MPMVAVAPCEMKGGGIGWKKGCEGQVGNRIITQPAPSWGWIVGGSGWEFYLRECSR